MFTILDDSTADFYTQHKTKDSMHFHTAQADEVAIRFGKCSSAAFNVILIQDSENHVDFFEHLRKKFHSPKSPHVFKGLTMKRLNQIAPAKFTAVMFRLGEINLTFIPRNTLRIYTSRECEVPRMCAKFHLWSTLPVSKFPQIERFEAGKTGEPRLFPMPDSNDCETAAATPFCFDLNPSEFKESRDAAMAHLETIMKGSTHRFPEQLQSQHVPRFHGNTGYGRCCLALLCLWQKIKPIIGDKIGQFQYVDAEIAWQIKKC